MDKEWKGFIIFIGILLIAIFIVWFIPSKSDNLSVLPKIIPEDNVMNKYIQSSELHWGHMPVTYHYNVLPSKACEDCSLVCAVSQKDKIAKAFNQIKEDTDNLVSFEEVQDNADIEIYCYGDKYSGVGEIITLGEGRYESYDNEITSGTLNFYGQSSGGKDSNCLELILHEIFHTFGFWHTTEGLMKPIGIPKISGNYRCQYEIDDYIIKDLKRIYG